MKKILFIVCLVILSGFDLSAQKRINIGDVKLSDFEFPETIKDSTAGAVSLFSKGFTTYDHEFNIILQVHERILILNETEFDRATIKIKHGDSDYVTKIKAASYNLENGKVIETELSRKDVFTEKLSDETKVERFTIPNVKKGSIIEYTYIVSSKNHYSLNTWYFQKYIPVVYSEYVVSMPQFYNYSQHLSGVLPITDFKTTTESANLGSYAFSNIVKTFISKNVPAFIKEDHISHPDNLISKIKFDLIDYRWPNRQNVVVNPSTFEQLSMKLASIDFYESVYRNNSFLEDDILIALQGLETASKLDQAKALYKFVQDNYTVDSDNDNDNIRQVHRERTGLKLDINSVLAAMLNNIGIEAFPVLISTRANGKLNRVYPSRANFNSSVCYLIVDNHRYFVDPTNKYLPFNMLNDYSINDEGLIISKENPGLISFGFTEAYNEKVSATFNILNDGSLQGVIDAHESGYASLAIRESFDNDLDKYKEEFQTTHKTWLIDEHEIIDAEERSFKEHLEVTIEPSVTAFDDLIVFSPLLINKITKNPFDLEVRTLPVTLDMPISLLSSFNYTIPDGYTVKELPEATSIALPQGAGRFSFSSQVVGNKISIISVLKVSRTEFTINEYYYLKEFYARVIEKQKEEIVLEKITNNE